jgi:hypothetical protein
MQVEAKKGGSREAIEAGNIGLADGSVQQSATEGLRRQVEAAKKLNGGGLTRIQLPEAGSSSSE